MRIELYDEALFFGYKVSDYYFRFNGDYYVLALYKDGGIEIHKLSTCIAISEAVRRFMYLNLYCKIIEVSKDDFKGIL